MKRIRTLTSFALLALSSLAACDQSEVAEQCVTAELISQCPVGSNPVIDAESVSACNGNFEENLVETSGSISGQCNSAGSCQFVCQFENPCVCGVTSITKDAIVCGECAEQSCGDGRCDGTERASCDGQPASCVPCDEDCGGATCGDGDCTGDENPQTCPQDCADTCVPSSRFCVGSIAKVCAANGQSTTDFDCATQSQVCRDGECVAP